MQVRSLVSLCLAVPVIVSLPVQAQDFPSKQVTLIVPFAVGQGSDILARSLGEKLTAVWGKPVVTDNKAGANGIIAVGALRAAAADGHTLLLTSNSPIVINPAIYKTLPYQPARDLAPVIHLASTSVLLVIGPQIPATSIRELVEYVKARPGKLSFGSPGTGSTSHLTMELLKTRAGLDMIHVPYKGSAQALTDIIGGQIQMMFDGPASSLPIVRSGRLKALAYADVRRSPFMPDVPTVAEAGFPGFAVGGWYGLLAPKDTPRAVVDKLNRDFAEVLKLPEIKERLTAQFFEPATPNTSQEFLAKINAEIALWTEVARTAKVEASE